MNFYPSQLPNMKHLHNSVESLANKLCQYVVQEWLVKTRILKPHQNKVHQHNIVDELQCLALEYPTVEIETCCCCKESTHMYTFFGLTHLISDLCIRSKHNVNGQFG